MVQQSMLVFEGLCCADHVLTCCLWCCCHHGRCLTSGCKGQQAGEQPSFQLAGQRPTLSRSWVLLSVMPVGVMLLLGS
jgi:hypothetical protein